MMATAPVGPIDEGKAFNMVRSGRLKSAFTKRTGRLWRRMNAQLCTQFNLGLLGGAGTAIVLEHRCMDLARVIAAKHQNH
jgi:hypothetical protein